MTANIREQLHQQIDKLPEHIVEQIANFTLSIMPEYVNWQDKEWQEFALEHFFQDEDEIEYSLGDAKEVY